MAFESSVAVQQSDDHVEFALQVENASEAEANLTFRSGLSADFAVLEDGEEIWRASDGQMFTQALRTESFDAGETKVYPAAWDDARPGDYTVVATLEVQEEDVEARAEFSV
ncbi:BsuPI-related putative proteinase inhibitor [Halorussus halophilus]|uniref:BsuPI-related putative proteinase inhibitor n=1 Tax=Halorussus halophilus TaxID=2650975 RepID=UPI001300EDE9|nr:BsuPI-related putative proteinase inhibitor [Halorussus halophilus]